MAKSLVGSGNVSYCRRIRLVVCNIQLKLPLCMLYISVPMELWRYITDMHNV